MTSATAHPVDDLAHRDAPDVHTPRVAAHAAERSTAVLNAVRDRPTAVRQLQELISRTVPVEEVHRVLSSTRVK
jgi:hypothetical protein